METPRTPLLSWPYYFQGKSIEELKHKLVCTTLELETTKLVAQEEIRKREEQLTHLQELLNKTITERDEAEENCKTLLLEKLLLQQQQQQQIAIPQVHSGSSSSIEDESTTTKKQHIVDSNNNCAQFSSSDCEESIICSPSSPLSQPTSSETALRLLSSKKPLPEKGKLLQAVIKAGPLLQTLLLAGPLPQWRHPPPPLENFDIPPVEIPAAAVNQPELAVHVHEDDFFVNGANVCGTVNKKRGFSYGVCDGFSSEVNKYQRKIFYPICHGIGATSGSLAKLRNLVSSMAEEYKLDPSSPYYLGPGDQPGNVISHVIFKGDNYVAWARAITLSLKAKRKFGFIDGTIAKPTDATRILDWETVNSMLVCWIMFTLDPKVAASIPFYDTASALWLYLERRYCVANGPRIQQLRAQINDCKQTKSMSVEDYFNKLMGLYDELDMLKPLHACTCGKCTCNVVDKYLRDRQEEKLHQFFAGLDDDL